ncbi:Detected protein of confused Function [Hibiscus syriacus]|uniref:Detected protein of confused Function n=1 Tax=Hibiscus syriacus TaxID=106335 RepID=A0A6A2WFF9_HIBSY|nr:Detected protein of confused Function [Hibiscus syriacus]
MAIQCNSAPLSCKPMRNRGPRPVYALLPARLFSLPQTLFSFHSDRLKLSACTWDKGVSAVGSSSSGTDVFNLTYLEGNSWLWDVSEVKILVDPILVGNLDFGIPLLYDAAKKFIMNFKLSDLPQLDCLLITQSLDDHCHLKTLKPLSEMSPNLRVVATPNAKALLDPLFRNVTYLEPGQESEVESSNGSK